MNPWFYFTSGISEKLGSKRMIWMLSTLDAWILDAWTLDTWSQEILSIFSDIYFFLIII